MSISPQHVEESISRAHVIAIAAIAGMVIDRPDLDYGSDGTFKTVLRFNGDLQVDGNALEYQLKASINIRDLNETEISYSMDSTAYNKIVARNNHPFCQPIVLIICQLAEKREHWVSTDLSQLSLKNCCFYHKMLDMELTTNVSSIAVHVPKANLLTAESLKELMDSVRNRTYRL